MGYNFQLFKTLGLICEQNLGFLGSPVEFDSVF